MLFLEKQHLPIFETPQELETVDRFLLRDLIIQKPANIVYFQTPERLYGMVSYGDIERSGDDHVRINRSFTSLTRREYMKAREIFKTKGIISEIPVTEDGRLVGEFHRYDDILLLERMRSWKHNKFFHMYWEKYHDVAIVLPGNERTYKQKYYERLKDMIISEIGSVTELTAAQAAERVDEFDAIFLVDEQEKRGIKILLSLFEKRENRIDRLKTCIDIKNTLESSEMIDYQKVIDRFREKNVDVILVEMKDRKTAYSREVSAKMAERFPVVDNNLNTLMRPYEKEFFDDLYEEDYVSNIRKGYFVVEKDQGSLRLRDVKSSYINVRDGMRRTTDQPEDFTRTIFFFGPCWAIGSYVADDYTIESCLQRMICRAGYRVRVVNCGSWGGNMACISRMLSSLIAEGDVIVALLEELDIERFDCDVLNIWDVLEKKNIPAEWMLDNPLHFNHHVASVYAEALYEMIFKKDYRDNDKARPFITLDIDMAREFYLDKYFYGCDMSVGKRVAASVINGNPFTNGHRYLIETAAEECDHVYLISVQENTSVFSSAERYAMAVDATKDLDNVTVVPSGLFLGTATLFPAYYAKIYMGNTKEQAEAHVRTFAVVAKALGVTHRYIGEEPDDAITQELNVACQKILPAEHIHTVILKRKEEEGRMVTGTIVRQLAAADDPEIMKFLPESSADIVQCRGRNVF